MHVGWRTPAKLDLSFVRGDKSSREFPFVAEFELPCGKFCLFFGDLVFLHLFKLLWVNDGCVWAFGMNGESVASLPRRICPVIGRDLAEFIRPLHQVIFVFEGLVNGPWNHHFQRIRALKWLLPRSNNCLQVFLGLICGLHFNSEERSIFFRQPLLIRHHQLSLNRQESHSPSVSLGRVAPSQGEPGTL